MNTTLMHAQRFCLRAAESIGEMTWVCTWASHRARALADARLNLEKATAALREYEASLDQEKAA